MNNEKAPSIKLTAGEIVDCLLWPYILPATIAEMRKAETQKETSEKFNFLEPLDLEEIVLQGLLVLGGGSFGSIAANVVAFNLVGETALSPSATFVSSVVGFYLGQGAIPNTIAIHYWAKNDGPLVIQQTKDTIDGIKASRPVQYLKGAVQKLRPSRSEPKL